MTQKENVLEYMQHGRSITPMDALNLFGCMSLAQRIANLKAEGHQIVTDMVTKEAVNGKKKTFASYRLKNPKPPKPVVETSICQIQMF